MKKFIAIALGLLILSGCSKNYQAEREFWKAEKVLATIDKTAPDQLGAGVLDPAVKAFQAVYDRYPASIKAVESLFVVSNLYVRQKKYDEAIQTLKLIVQNYGDMKDRVAEARYGIAGLHELKGDWAQAEATLWEMAQNHAFHQKGLYAPIRIMIHYKKANDAIGAEKAYFKAIETYRRLLKDTGPISAAGMVKNYMGLAELTYGNWQQAREIWLSISDEFPESGYGPLALLAAGEISWKKDDYGSGIAAYEKFLKLYPKHVLAVRAMAQIGAIYVAKSEFVKGREWFQKSLEGQKSPAYIADTQLLIAHSYQKENNWTEAEKLYKEIKTQYPSSNAALQIPFLTANYYEAQGNQDMVKKVLDEAIAGYQSLIDSGDPQSLALVERLQSQAIAEKGDWQQLLQNFDEKIQRETSDVRKGNWIILKALITENRIQDSKAALSLYENFLTQFPEHPMTDLAKSRSEALHQKTSTPTAPVAA